MNTTSRILDPGEHATPPVSLLTLIEREIKLQNLSFHQLAQQSGINRGLLSALFTRIPPKPMSIRQLDLIGKALGKSKGWLYDAYVAEYFSNEKIHWKQIKNILLRCVELGKDSLVDEILNRTTEDPVYIQNVFLLAEKLFAEGKRKEAIPFYRCVCANEIKQHSERLAISHYKWFRARMGSNLKENYEAAVQFAPYRHRLPVNMQLDGLLQLANVHFSVHHLDEVIQYADEMNGLMNIVLKQKSEHVGKRKTDEPFLTERHLVFYYGQSFLLKGNALEWMGQYEQALEYISGYEDLSLFDGLDETGWKEVEKFKRFAEANRFNLMLLLGRFECLSDYLVFLDQHPEEWLPSLLTIMNAVNRHGYEAEQVLAHFECQVHDLFTANSLSGHSYYQDIFQSDRCARLCYQLALYSLSHGQAQRGREWLLKASLYSASANGFSLG